ncbi:type III polyketide synthase [Candidatus Laterigemmans baculatus]|uniref:type III polyketide synthase n=1 Tax=Candidatus Laterigemmans baculatus TaxID=2770505 RepID=UPI0013D95DC3|nr:type III polyketide synthase [Candidatus Laterigemmans baculatus]
MNRPLLLGLGTAVPPYQISQSSSATVARRFVHESEAGVELLPALYRMTRVRRRGSVLLEGPSDGEVHQSFYPHAESLDDRGPSTADRMERYGSEAGPLAIRSAAAALADAELPASRVTHLVTVTCTGFYAPGFDAALIEELGMSLDVERVQVGFMGCHGAINGLRVARAISRADASAVVLVVAVELCSLHYQYGWDTDRVVSNALFADGSSALVVAGSDLSPPELAPLEIAATGSRMVPDSREAMTWRIGNHGFEMTLSATVPSIIEDQLRDFLCRWLAAEGFELASIGGWAVHPGGPRILQAVEAALELPREALRISREVLAEHGNMSSATLLFILEQFRRERIPGPWLMLGFGPGLVIEVALLR